jgi:TetR/AcrR family transcriptional regulator, tetracycline repressor protein
MERVTDNPRRRPDLTRQKVVAAALRLVDREGLDGLTMRALGRELGVDPMAIYYHVPNKAAVLDGVTEAVWSEIELPEPSGQPWQVELEQIATAIRETLRRHPHALPILATRPNTSVPGLRVTDRTLGVLLAAGFPPAEALEFVNAAGEFLMGHVLSEAGAPLASADTRATGEGEAAGGDDDAILAAVDSAGAAEQFPHLARTLNQVDLRSVTMDRIFDAGLAALRRGLEHRLSELSGER